MEQQSSTLENCNDPFFFSIHECPAISSRPNLGYARVPSKLWETAIKIRLLFWLVIRRATGPILSDEDREQNEQAIIDGSRILSAYVTKNGTKLWVITEAADDTGQRSATTILLPEEY